MFYRGKMFSLKTVLAVCLGTMMVYGQSAPLDVTVKASLEKANIAYQNRDFETAKRELRSVQAARDDLAEPFLLLGMIAWQEGKAGDAVKLLKNAIKLQPHYPDAHYILGRLFFETMKWKEAENEATLAISQGAKFGNVQVLLGNALLVQGKTKLAVEAYELAAKLPSPNDEVTSEMQERLAAVKNFIDFLAHKSDPNYVWPQRLKNQQTGLLLGVTGTVKIMGILNEKGEFRPFVLASADATAGQRDQLIQKALAYRYSPATINGKPVSFWLMLEYQHSTSINRF